ncbi:MAG: AsnC family transcriptional regulator [Candidatus Woesearchaeota archaeon]|jgi:DNA-binding Lrp family transcriptional regulator
MTENTKSVPDKKPTKIDIKDKKIMSILAQDSRAPLSKVGKSVLLSRDTVDYRIKRLIQKKAITLFHPKINYKKLGYFTYHVFMLIDEVHPERKEEFISALRKEEHVIMVIEYSDKWDLEVIMIAKNVEEFDTAITTISRRFPKMILEKDILEVITSYCDLELPREVTKHHIELQTKKDNTLQQIKLDKKDFEILHSLCKDAKASTYNIGETIGLSNDAVIYRMKKLLSQNIIEKFTTMFDFDILGYHTYMCTIQVTDFDKEHEDKFKEFVKNHNNIVKAEKTLGIWDLLIMIVVQNPIDFHKTLKEIKKEFSDIIKTHDVWIEYKMQFFEPTTDILKNNIQE